MARGPTGCGWPAPSSPRALAREAGARSSVPLGGLLGSAAGGALPDGGRARVPLALNAGIASRGGRPEVQDATGSVSGVPAGPLTEIVARAVLDRL
jgi:hypothetical protein